MNGKRYEVGGMSDKGEGGKKLCGVSCCGSKE